MKVAEKKKKVYCKRAVIWSQSVVKFVYYAIGCLDSICNLPAGINHFFSRLAVCPESIYGDERRALSLLDS